MVGSKFGGFIIQASSLPKGLSIWKMSVATKPRLASDAELRSTLSASCKVLPIVNVGELAVIYCFVFLLFAIRGAGDFSLDRRLARL